MAQQGKSLVLEQWLLIQPNICFSSIQNTGTVPMLAQCASLGGYVARLPSLSLKGCMCMCCATPSSLDQARQIC